MKKKLSKGKVRCGACEIILSKKELYEHLKSEEHLRKAKKVREAYEKSLNKLTNFGDL